MGAKYLIDSNILIEYAGLLLPSSLQQMIGNIMDEEFNISFISKIEVLGYVSSEVVLEQFINSAYTYTINTDIINETIKLRKQKKIKLPDAIVAATAIVNNLTLITRNIGDFKSIPNLNVVNPYDWK